MDDIAALLAERDRLRRELDHAITMNEEWEALVGAPFRECVIAAQARVSAGKPYALAEVLGNLSEAFRSVAEDRNMWRARAKRASNVARGRE